MLTEDVKTVIVTLGLLAESEGILAELYEVCGSASGDAAFWGALAKQERGHSVNLKEMARLIMDANGDGFEVERRFPANAIQSFMQYVRDNLAGVRNGSIKGIKLYQLAREIERAVLDQRYPDVVKTENRPFNALMKKIIVETEGHLRVIEERIGEQIG